MGVTYRRQSVFVALANLPILNSRSRMRVLRHAGVVAGTPSLVHRGVVVQGLGTLRLGSGCFVNYGCYFDTVADITIGNSVFLADHVRVLTSSHEIGSAAQRASTLKSESVMIGDGAWIGSGAAIMPGVTIGSGTIVGANSLVTRDCKPNSVYAGSPAEFRRELD
ncbi:acyltransferase [Antrihabitans sp. YC3-6]|uniref:Acyltransferase n=1 Tax=Antrihabitans stalagmiti TaxID=2799499 RepID=A0A934NQ00_9NOCA|nr:acyltransferase [Antrihabitans stalagmiti]MBJ8339233.1 acyltransferase [Antrihabitans stalagmiti]